MTSTISAFIIWLSSGSGERCSRSTRRGLSKLEEVNGLTKSGGVDKYASRGFGDAHDEQALRASPIIRSGRRETRYIAMLPTVHNFDSFGYDTRVFTPTARNARAGPCCSIRARMESSRSSTSPPSACSTWRSRPKPRGVLRFDNIGNMSPLEIGALFRFLRGKRQEGFVRRCWRTGQQAAKIVPARRCGDPEHVVAGLQRAGKRVSRREGSRSGRGLSGLAWRAERRATCLGAAARHGLRIHGLVAVRLGGSGDGPARAITSRCRRRSWTT